MKKTLTALLAMVGVAAAGTVDTGATSLNEYIIASADLTLEQLTKIIATDNTSTSLLGVKDSGNNVWSISVNSWEGRNELHIYNKQAGESVSGNAAASFSDSESWPSNHDMKATFDLTDAVRGAITLGYQGANTYNENGEKIAHGGISGTAVTLSVLYNDGSVKTVYGLCTGYKYSDNYITEVSFADNLVGTPDVTVSTTLWTKDSLIAANKVALGVPEPSTATLSLLALAGLVARRRRK